MRLHLVLKESTQYDSSMGFPGIKSSYYEIVTDSLVGGLEPTFDEYLNAVTYLVNQGWEYERNISGAEELYSIDTKKFDEIYSDGYINNVKVDTYGMETVDASILNRLQRDLEKSVKSKNKDIKIK